MDREAIHILLIEDNPGDARLLQELIKEAGMVRSKVMHVDLLSTGLKQLAAGGFHVVLLDLSLPDSQGLETLTRLHTQAPDLPIVVLTGLEDESLGVTLIQAGAQDYLVKGQVNSQLLLRALRYAIERGRAEAEIIKRNRELLTLQSAGAAIVSSLDLQYVMETVTREMTALLEVEGCAICEWNQADDTISTMAEYGPPAWRQARSLAKVYRLVDFPLTKRVLQERRAEQMTIDQPEIEPTELTYMQAGNLKTLLMLPMEFQDRVIGLAEIEDTRTERIFTDPEMGLAQLLANQAASAIKNARLHTETKWRAQQLAVLHELDQAISANLHIDEVYHALARHTTRLIAYQHMSITLLEEDGPRVTYAANQNSLILPTGSLLSLETSAVGWVVARGQPLLRHHIAADMRFAEDEQLVAEGIQSSMIIPLWIKGHIIGAWNISSHRIRNYSQDDLKMAQFMADQLAIAIANARLYEQARQEIAERRRAEEDRHESEKRYRTLVETSPDAIVLTDLEGKILICNQRTAVLYRVKNMAELVGKNIFELIAPEDLPRAVDTMRKTLETGNLSNVEYTLLKQNGLRFPVELNTSLIVDKAGQPSGFISVIRDITQRKRAEARLRLLESAVVNAKDGILITEAGLIDSPGPAILYANEAFTRMTGYSQAEVLGLTPRLLQGPKTDRAQLDKIRVALAQGEPVQVELINYRKDGSEYWVELNIVPVADDRGQFIHLISVQREITERKQLEEQLRQSQKMEAIGRLAGGIAHDFNNLLTVINGYSELLLQRHLDNKHPLRKYIVEIDKAGERASGLTRQLLAFSRKQVLRLEVLDLNAVIADIDMMLQRLIGEDIDLITVPEQGLGRVKADPGQMEQVIVNLAVNARDAMPQGGKLTIETANVELDEWYVRQHAEVTAGSYVMLAVSDTGLGMDKETLSHIFEPFFTTKQQGKGTGLGLATVYGIIKQSGGHIWVYSEVGRGTMFKVYLPRIREATEAADSGSSYTELAQGSETILLVEDEAGVRELILEVLTGRGYTVLEARNGDEALKLCEQRSGSIHLLLTDVVMPGGMNGRELADRLTSLHPELKVLYMSGYTDEAIIHHGVLERSTIFLQKPFTPDALERKAREVLDMTS